MNPIALLYQSTGLTARRVSMVLGNRASYAGYVASYDFVDMRLRQAIGAEIYAHFKEQGDLTAQHVQSLTAIASARQAERVARK